MKIPFTGRIEVPKLTPEEKVEWEKQWRELHRYPLPGTEFLIGMTLKQIKDEYDRQQAKRVWRRKESKV